ncbi:hypothetical protein McPS_23980 [Marichromatium sp. PS1]|uniref:hypothetical protein n=1 Tax=Marichromatium sp. PS1 TaxID=3138932 RepID=UPI0032E55F17
MDSDLIETYRSGHYRLEDIEFVGYKSESGGLDEDNFITKEVYKTRFMVGRSVDEDQAKNVFRRAFAQAGNFFGDVDSGKFFVRIKSPDGAVKRAELEGGEEVMLEQAFIQSELIEGFDCSLTSRCDDFRFDVIDKMIDLTASLSG